MPFDNGDTSHDLETLRNDNNEMLNDTSAESLAGAQDNSEFVLQKLS